LKGNPIVKKETVLQSFIAAALLAAPLLVSAQGEKDAGHGRAVVTIFSKHNEVAPEIAEKDVSLKVNGKDSTITNWAPFKPADENLELIILIDDNARNLGRQFEEIKQFVQGQGPKTKIAVGYMENGNTNMAGPLTANRAQAIAEVHLPAGPLSNPYFSLSDMAKRWPSQDPKARREVVMFTDGVDPNNPRFDPEDPYVLAAIKDAVQAHLVVYTIYWRSRQLGGEGSPIANGGQSLLSELADATGGNNYWTGTDNPVTFQPYFKDLMRRFASQYDLTFTTRLDKKPTVDELKLKVEGLSLQVTAPKQVFVSREMNGEPR
jgi:hypothetical protein